MGDGWCDFQNNRGYCGWDGGDCCASTAKGGKVKLMFPTLCTSHLCRCLDPYAIENRNDLERAKFFTDRGLENVFTEDKSKATVITNESQTEPYLSVLKNYEDNMRINQIISLKFRPWAKFGSKELRLLNLAQLTTSLTNNNITDIYKTLFFSTNSSQISFELSKIEILAEEYKNFIASKKYVDALRASVIRALQNQYQTLQLKS